MADEEKPAEQPAAPEATSDQPEPTPAAPAETDPAPQNVPADALERPDSEVLDATGEAGTPDKNIKKPNAFISFLRRFNVYFLLFLLVVIVAVAVSVVMYLNSRKSAPNPTVVNQNLTPDQLKQIANSSGTVGGSGQTLTVQGNAVFDGQLLVKNNLNVAGTLQLGAPLSVQNITVSNTANLQNTQINTLQVAQGSTFQGTVTVQNNLNVGGLASFGNATVGTLTVTKLVMSGSAQLQVPNHVAFTGYQPGRTLGDAIGGGGSVSVGGSDTAGTININTGNGPISPGCFATVNFNVKYTSTPHVMVSPVGVSAGRLDYYVNRSTTSFSICTANSPDANASFAFDYFVTGQ